ncbi:MAG: hypothetical protein EWM47_13330 [Anaerolineaceae bacterium]|nr:MAG: hypothetical protein EWM47_13330 [Anaerolineaceae bacterium]
MKKRILIIVLVILSVFLLLMVCNNGKQDSKNVENTDTGTVKIGIYFGVPYRITSSFMPIITLENNDKFRFDLGINNSVEGTYRIDNNKLILTSSGGDENYTLEINNNILVIEQEICNYVKKGTRFKLAEKE